VSNVNRVIVDVREPYEFAQGHVAGAINIPPADLMAGAESLKGVPKDTEIILYCRTGSRSSVAMHILRSLGFTNLVNGINQDHVEARLSRE
jgi:phage shock protein E